MQDKVVESLGILADNQVPFEVVGVLTEHLECVSRLGEMFPHLSLMLDHLCHPRGVLTAQIMNQWENDLKRVAENPHVFAKISGLGTVVKKAGEKLDVEDIKPIISFALATFGVPR